jgi:AcrR family transcriptional regulator
MVQAQALSRRDRVRAATTQEILQTARQLLVDQGASAISLRAIAREMGMTAPALYRYFGSHEELLRHVVGDIFTDLAQHVRAAIEAAAEAAGSDRAPEDLMAVKLIAGCREFRAWALTHVPEFDMIFGSPLPGLHLDHTDPVAECGYQFGQVFLDLFGNRRRDRPLAAPPAHALPRPGRHGPAAGRTADVPALLGAALRDGRARGRPASGVRAG